MQRNKIIVIASIFIILLTFSFLSSNGVFGVRENRLEQDATESQKINKTWLNAKDVNGEMGALLSYNKALDDHTFSIYLNRPGISYGYFFNQGGYSSTIEAGIKGFSYENYAMVLMSMNSKNVSEMKLKNKKSIEIIQIDSSKPFVLLVPNNTEKVSLFDASGNDVPIDNIELN